MDEHNPVTTGEEITEPTAHEIGMALLQMSVAEQRMSSEAPEEYGGEVGVAKRNLRNFMRIHGLSFEDIEQGINAAASLTDPERPNIPLYVDAHREALAALRAEAAKEE